MPTRKEKFAEKWPNNFHFLRNYLLQGSVASSPPSINPFATALADILAFNWFDSEHKLQNIDYIDQYFRILQ